VGFQEEATLKSLVPPRHKKSAEVPWQTITNDAIKQPRRKSSTLAGFSAVIRCKNIRM
jgi:hypothetical protein